MKTNDIEAKVADFRAQELVKVSNRFNATAPRDQSAERIAREMAGVDHRVARYRASLGQPDDPQPDESQATPAVLPGVKGKS